MKPKLKLFFRDFAFAILLVTKIFIKIKALNTEIKFLKELWISNVGLSISNAEICIFI